MVLKSGFERIIYSVLQSNTTDLGKPNSCMVGADLFFESPDAFIHIDAKSYQPRTNTKDHWRNKIEANQSSYKTNYQVIMIKEYLNQIYQVIII